MGNAVLNRRGQAKKEIHFEGKHLRLELKSKEIESILVEFEEGAEFGRMYSHEGEEIHLVLKGIVEYKVGEEVFHLKTGDSLWHDSMLPHTARNAGKEPAKVLTVSTGTTFM